MDNPTVEYNTVDPNITDSNEKEYEIVIDQAGKKRRRRKRKHRVRKHSPEYYEQLKLAKLNKKRQTEWNSRFVLESLPTRTDGLAKAKSTKKAVTRNQQRMVSPKQGAKVYRTFNAGENKNKNGPSKSFNIRLVNKKQDTNQTMIEAKKQVNEQSSSEKTKLQQSLRQVYEQKKFNENHYEILKDIIKNSKSKSLTSYIHAEIARLKNNQSTCDKVQAAINDRNQCIQKLSQMGTSENEKKEKISNYQLSTLRVLEQILKWKQDTEKVFKEQTQMKTKVAYKKDGKNYVVNMGSQVKFLCKQQWEDVFLLSLVVDNVQNDLIVKIRACETLILEEMLENK